MTPIGIDPDPAPDAADRALEADLRELLGGEEPADRLDPRSQLRPGPRVLRHRQPQQWRVRHRRQLSA